MSYQTIRNPRRVKGTENKEPSKTIRGIENQVNINQIVARAIKGQVVPISTKSPMYGDFTQVNDYQSVQNRIIEINKEFMRIPAKIREKFHNNPAKFMDFLQNPENKQYCIEMGLIKKERIKETVAEKPEEVKSTIPS